MGIEALALAGLGAGLGAYNTSRTMNAQNSALNQEVADQQMQQARANSVLRGMIQKVQASTPTAAKTQLSSAYLNAIKQGQQQANLALALPVGAASTAYRDAVTRNAADVNNYGNTQGTLLADMGAPELQRQYEGFDVGRAGTAVSGIARAAADQDAIDRMRVMSIRRNPWLDFLGQAMGSYGMGKAMGGTGAGISSRVPTMNTSSFYDAPIAGDAINYAAYA